MIKHPVANTKDGTQVYVDLIKSPASTTISQQPHVVTLVREVLSTISPQGKKSTIEFDFGHTIGNSDIVGTTEKDHIMYAKPQGRDIFFRFVRRRQPEQTNFVTIVLLLDDDGDYELRDVWMGRDMPAMPGTSHESADSKEYWETHARVIEGYPLQNRTLTLTRPY